MCRVMLAYIQHSPSIVRPVIFCHTELKKSRSRGWTAYIQGLDSIHIGTVGKQIARKYSGSHLRIATIEYLSQATV